MSIFDKEWFIVKRKRDKLFLGQSGNNAAPKLLNEQSLKAYLTIKTKTSFSIDKYDDFEIYPVKLERTVK